MTHNFLVGAWRLLAYESRTPDGKVGYPLGPGATGYIMYTADGHMSVAMMGAGRRNYASGDLKGGTPEERAAAADSYISYCGTYELRENSVVHHIEAALFPNRVGTRQERFFTLAGNRLLLRTPPMLIEGKERTAHLIWERA